MNKFTQILNQVKYGHDVNTLLEFLKIPNGDNDTVFKMFQKLSGARKAGSGLGQYLYKEGTRKDKVLLVAHADTASDDMKPKQLSKVISL